MLAKDPTENEEHKPGEEVKEYVAEVVAEAEAEVVAEAEAESEIVEESSEPIVIPVPAAVSIEQICESFQKSLLINK